MRVVDEGAVIKMQICVTVLLGLLLIRLSDFLDIKDLYLDF